MSLIETEWTEVVNKRKQKKAQKGQGHGGPRTEKEITRENVSSNIFFNFNVETPEGQEDEAEQNREKKTFSSNFFYDTAEVSEEKTTGEASEQDTVVERLVKTTRDENKENGAKR